MCLYVYVAMCLCLCVYIYIDVRTLAMYVSLLSVVGTVVRYDYSLRVRSCLVFFVCCVCSIACCSNEGLVTLPIGT